LSIYNEKYFIKNENQKYWNPALYVLLDYHYRKILMDYLTKDKGKLPNELKIEIYRWNSD